MAAADYPPTAQSGPEGPLIPSIIVEAAIRQREAHAWLPDEHIPRALARVCDHLNTLATRQQLMGETIKMTGDSARIPTYHAIAGTDEVLHRDTEAPQTTDDIKLGEPPSVVGNFAGFHYDIDRTTNPPRGYIVAQAATREVIRTRYGQTIPYVSCRVDDESATFTFLDEMRREKIEALFSRLDHESQHFPEMISPIARINFELLHSENTTIDSSVLQRVTKEVNELAANPDFRGNSDLVDIVEDLLRLYLRLPQRLIVSTNHYRLWSPESPQPISRTLQQPKRFPDIEPDVLVVQTGESAELCFVTQTIDGLVHIPTMHVQHLKRRVY